jgi:hypothetical protein
MIDGMTFGYELELGDVLRSRKIPEELGSWEYAETDIVNLRKPYADRATDPLGLEPPVGGEINVFPGKSPEEVAQRADTIIKWFRSQGDSPTAGCVNHGHVHVRVPGLRDDIRLLKRLTNWIAHNQDELINRAYGYDEHPWMAKTRTARTYLKWDGGRPMPSWMAANIIRNAKSFDDFIRIQCCGKDGVSMGRPFRYAVNTYCMKHTDTIEFRCFRSTLSYNEILDSLRLVESIMVEALQVDGMSIREIFSQYQYQLPELIYDHESYLGWEQTKYPKERGKKQRYYREI